MSAARRARVPPALPTPPAVTTTSDRVRAAWSAARRRSLPALAACFACLTAQSCCRSISPDGEAAIRVETAGDGAPALRIDAGRSTITGVYVRDAATRRPLWGIKEHARIGDGRARGTMRVAIGDIPPGFGSPYGAERTVRSLDDVAHIDVLVTCQYGVWIGIGARSNLASFRRDTSGAFQRVPFASTSPSDHTEPSAFGDSSWRLPAAP